jgi:ABC-type multidrug transport system ATPase subunit
MDCIAGRKTTGRMRGRVLLNGQPADIRSAFFQQLCGYVEQNDLHIGTATVEEALRFSACLRLPVSVPIAVQHAFVREVMVLLGLDAFATHLIGDAAIPGLGPAQLKLVTIGVELVANPSILFLDEPTRLGRRTTRAQLSFVVAATCWRLRLLMRGVRCVCDGVAVWMRPQRGES